MKITLVLTDSSSECRKALEWLAKYEQLFSAEVEVFAVLEDIYRLESASVSLGVPLPPDTVSKAKERTRDRIITLWRHIKGNEEANLNVDTVAGEIREEVIKFVSDRKPDMIIWGCSPTPDICRVIDQIDIPSLIIK